MIINYLNHWGGNFRGYLILTLTVMKIILKIKKVLEEIHLKR